MSFSRVLQLTTVICATFMVIGCESADEVVNTPVTQATSVQVRVLPLQAEPWSYTLTTYGQLRSADTVAIGTESGGTVEKVYVREGSIVSSGQKLASLDNDKQQFRLKRAMANRESIAADLEQAQRQLDKFERVIAAGTVSKEMLEQARTARNSLAARVSQADSEISIAKRELTERTITSPIDGVVVGEPVDAGERIAAGQTLLTIQSNNALQVTTWVNQDEVNQVSRGQTAKVTVSASDAEFSATVESVSRSASASTGNFEIKLRLEDAVGSLREGMSARVEIALRNSRDVVFIPRNAVIDRDRSHVVFIAESGIARMRKPRFGLPDNERIPVLSGIEPGDLLITEPLAYITDGSQVIIEGAN